MRPFGAACLASGFCAPSSPFVIAGSFGGSCCLEGIFLLTLGLAGLMELLARLYLVLPEEVFLFG